MPGFEAQASMTPPGRLPADRATLMTRKTPREGAVLAILNPQFSGEHTLVYIKRTDYEGTHGGQISFPGGKLETEDSDAQYAAMRETWEEIGIDATQYEVLGEISPVYIPPSNFLVNVFIGIALEKLQFNIDPKEVEYVLEVPVDDLLDEASVSAADFNTAYGKLKNYPCFKFGGHVVWGATAMMTAEIKELLKNQG